MLSKHTGGINWLWRYLASTYPGGSETQGMYVVSDVDARIDVGRSRGLVLEHRP